MNKRFLEQIIDTTAAGQDSILEGLVMLAEQNTETQKKLEQIEDYLEQQDKDSKRGAYIDVILDITIAALGALLAMILTGVIYY